MCRKCRLTYQEDRGERRIRGGRSRVMHQENNFANGDVAYHAFSEPCFHGRNLKGAKMDDNHSIHAPYGVCRPRVKEVRYL